MDAELSQPEQHQQDAEQQLQPAGEQGFALLELPRDALVAVLTAAGDMDEYRKHHLRALACSCQQLNLLARTCVPFCISCRNGDPVEHLRLLTTPDPTWSGCTRLEYICSSAAALGVLPGMLAAAARWPRCCGLLLGVHVPKEEKVPLPPLPPPPALLQQQQEQEEGQEEQDDIVYTAEPSRYVRQDLLTSSPLHSLRLLPQLLDLTLSVDAFGPQTAAALSTAAPQLTSLTVGARYTPLDHRMAGQTLCHPPSDLSPLTGLTSLRKLVLNGCVCVAPVPQQQPSAANVPTSSSNSSRGSSSVAAGSCLPVNLQELSFDRVGVLPYWLTHLAGCPQLQKLQVQLQGHRRYAADHPALVAAAALQHVPGLRSLRFTGWAERRGMVWTAQPAWPPGAVGAEAAGGGAAVPVGGGGAGGAAAAVAPLDWRPQGALLGLTGLQQLQADPSAPLVLGSAADWQGLAHLDCLTILENVYVCSCPPAGLTLPPLQALLGVHIAVPAAATRHLLGALPGLSKLTISKWSTSPVVGGTAVQEGARVASQQQAAGGSTQQETTAGGIQQGPSTAVLSSSLTQLCVNYRRGNHTTAAAAAHFSTAFGGVTALRRLVLYWPSSSDAAPHLPDLSPFPELLVLELYGFGAGDMTLEEDLLLMLRPAGGGGGAGGGGAAASLKALVLNHMPLVSPRAVLALQQELTALTRLTLFGCGKLQLPAAVAAPTTPGAADAAHGGGELAARSQQRQWELLKQLVLPRLTFQVDNATIA